MSDLEDLEAIALSWSLKPNKGKLNNTAKNKGVGSIGYSIARRAAARRSNHTKQHITLPRLNEAKK